MNWFIVLGAAYLVSVIIMYPLFLTHWRLAFSLIDPDRPREQVQADNAALAVWCLLMAVLWFAVLDLYLKERRQISEGTYLEAHHG